MSNLHQIERPSGLPSKPREQEPCMFQIMSWTAEEPLNLDKEPQKPICAIETHLLQPSEPQQQQNSQPGQDLKQSLPNTQHLQTYCARQQIQPHPKKLRHKLNSCEQAHLRRSQSQTSFDKLKETKGTLKPKQEIFREPQHKLDESNLKDRQVIEERKQRIKQFGILSREIPNSSFVTYYGKPAFEAYGRGSSTCHLKSHNVMPHRGVNHPKSIQSHYNALVKGRTTQVKDHLPRKPIEVPAEPSQPTVVGPVNLPIDTPDLINHIRFTKVSTVRSNNQPIPSQNQPQIPERKKIAQKQNKVQKKGRKKAKPKKEVIINDGLKYMNKRQNLLTLLEQKKTKQSKLAYKVTQCYPKQWHCMEGCELSAATQWAESRPAGKLRQPCDKVSDLMATGTHYEPVSDC